MSQVEWTYVLLARRKLIPLGRASYLADRVDMANIWLELYLCVCDACHDDCLISHAAFDPHAGGGDVASIMLCLRPRALSHADARGLCCTPLTLSPRRGVLCATRTRVSVTCVYVCMVVRGRAVPMRFVCALIIGMHAHRLESAIGGSASEFAGRRDPTRRVAAST